MAFPDLQNFCNQLAKSVCLPVRMEAEALGKGFSLVINNITCVMTSIISLGEYIKFVKFATWLLGL